MQNKSFACFRKRQQQRQKHHHTYREHMQNCIGSYTDNAATHCSMFNPISCSYSLPFALFFMDVLLLLLLLLCSAHFVYKKIYFSIFTCNRKHQTCSNKSSISNITARLRSTIIIVSRWERAERPRVRAIQKNDEKAIKRCNIHSFIHTNIRAHTHTHWRNWREMVESTIYYVAAIWNMIGLNMCQWRCTMDVLSVSLFRLESDKFALFSP